MKKFTKEMVDDYAEKLLIGLTPEENKMILDDEMVITTESGEEKVMKILFTYESEQRKKEYVFLHEKDDEENVLVFAVNNKDQSLEEIEDDDEYEEAEEVFNAYMNDEKIQEIKK